MINFLAYLYTLFKWLLKYFNKKGIWIDKNNNAHIIREMSDEHLINVLHFLKRRTSTYRVVESNKYVVEKSLNYYLIVAEVKRRKLKEKKETY